jgi:F0F1-type ATP synthase assembly protein I
VNQETKISLYTFVGMGLVCLALGWIIKDKIHSGAPFVIFLFGILICFLLTYKTINAVKWENIRDQFKHKK